MTLSNHANRRAKQRGITTNIVDNLLIYGVVKYAHDNCWKYHLNLKSMKRARKELSKKDYLILEKKRTSYLVINSITGIILTVGYINKRIKHIH